MPRAGPMTGTLAPSCPTKDTGTHLRKADLSANEVDGRFVRKADLGEAWCNSNGDGLPHSNSTNRSFASI